MCQIQSKIKRIHVIFVFSCWQKLPEERPSIKEIRRVLDILRRVIFLFLIVYIIFLSRKKQAFNVTLFCKVFDTCLNYCKSEYL